MSFNSASKILSEGVGVFKNTGLSSVMFKNNIYVFYSGVGNDGAWYGVGPGASPRTAQWTGPSSCRNSGATIMSLSSYTSPCAVAFDNRIWVFFNGSGNNGTFWTTSQDGVI
ncbi:hypothetical protein Forpe1208_v015236 [Fusarium oxysporum f. sp. rapae]|uniref:Uncharacterized protein n=1 Tax=Fusarium oxysporum f. sp. rapae TaxID=485398 RepID=A0A8J5TYX2_FUSOX|nr:hypothetical protein Forpe1208_v015236 [Fusarium oxysporum f. sp. rapae]